jgi:hypothetical protein
MNDCGFCKNPIEQEDKKQRRHIFPIPVCDAYPDGGTLNQGATACGECVPELEKLQVQQGLLELVSSDPLDRKLESK